MKQGKATFFKATIFIIGLLVVTLCIFWLPGLAKETAVMNPEYAYLRFPLLVGVYVTAIPFFLALYHASRILSNIEGKNSFSKFDALGHIKNCALAIIILDIIGSLFLISHNALHPVLAVIGTVIIFANLVLLLFTTVLRK